MGSVVDDNFLRGLKAASFEAGYGPTEVGPFPVVLQMGVCRGTSRNPFAHALCGTRSEEAP
jgi:hypothetical protein